MKGEIDNFSTIVVNIITVLIGLMFFNLFKLKVDSVLWVESNSNH